jgi:pyridoxine/pyridoxamine 5'-phosphate oxidase
MHGKQEILDFISKKPHMVISTINSRGEPESAVVGFGQTKNFELIIGISVNSRKAQNILSNEHVSVVIGWDIFGTVQYQGRARMHDTSKRSG